LFRTGGQIPDTAYVFMVSVSAFHWQLHVHVNFTEVSGYPCIVYGQWRRDRSVYIRARTREYECRRRWVVE